jgi:chemotaxis protein CheD
VENLAVLARDVGTEHPRKVLFHPRSGRVRVKRLRRLEDRQIVQRELDYMQRLEKAPPKAGDVELF